MRQIISGLLGATALGISCVAGAFAADMPLKAPVAAPMVAAPSWTGWYAGVNVGYGWGDPGGHLDFNVAGAGAPLAPGDYNTRTSGFIGGVQAGYNYQINNFVVGAETDIQYVNVHGATTTPSTFVPGVNNIAHVSLSEKLSWFGTLRGRVGVLPMDNLLIYGTGGLAYGRVTAPSIRRIAMSRRAKFDMLPMSAIGRSRTPASPGPNSPIVVPSRTRPPLKCADTATGPCGSRCFAAQAD